MDFEIENGILKRYSGLCASVDVPEGVTEIGERAFFNQHFIKEVRLPNGLSIIGESAFAWSENIERINIPNTVTHISYRAFTWCKHISNIELPETLTKIDDWAFFGCKALTRAVIPHGVKKIEEGTFSLCYNLSEVIIPSSIYDISKEAFANCHALTEVVIPEGVQTIGPSAFKGCKNLTGVTLPDSITHIGADAFEEISEKAIIRCSIATLSLMEEANEHALIYAVRGFIERYAKGETNAEEARGLRRYVHDLRKKLYRSYINDPIVFRYLTENEIISPKRIEPLYKQTSNSECKEMLLSYAEKFGIADKVGVAENSEFTVSNGVLKRYCGTDTEVVIPEGITEIGNSAFRENATVTSVYIPDGVTKIGKGAFMNCASLHKVRLPDTLLNIANDAFSVCPSLSEISLPEGLTNIGCVAFANCTSLTSVHIPSTVELIRSQAFRGCSALCDIHIPDGVGRIYSEVFLCTAYMADRDAKTENGLLYIGNHLISANTTLCGKVTVREGTVGIADNAFRFCTQITEIRLPEGLRTVGHGAFSGCQSLRSVNIPDSVVNIWPESFDFINKQKALETVYADIKLCKYLSYYDNTIPCVIVGWLKRWNENEISVGERYSLIEYVTDNFEKLIDKLLEYPLFIGFIIRFIINVEKARSLLETVENAECRMRLLEFIEKNSTGDAFQELEL